MHSDEIIVGDEQGEHQNVSLPFLAEGVREARPARPPDRLVLHRAVLTPTGVTLC